MLGLCSRMCLEEKLKSPIWLDVLVLVTLNELLLRNLDDYSIMIGQSNLWVLLPHPRCSNFQFFCFVLFFGFPLLIMSELLLKVSK